MNVIKYSLSNESCWYSMTWDRGRGRERGDDGEEGERGGEGEEGERERERERQKSLMIKRGWINSFPLEERNDDYMRSWMKH